MSYGYIYKITCLINNKFYIGQSTNLKDVDTYFGSGVIIKHALKKYGKKFFRKDILGFCETQKDLDEAEETCVAFFQSNNKLYGYNIMTGGEGKGRHSEETKKKIRERQKGKIVSSITREKIGLAHKGKVIPQEARDKMSNAKKGKLPLNFNKLHTPESHLKISQTLKGRTPWNKGKPHSEEAKKKMREAKIGMVSPMKGKKHTEETKKKISETKRKNYTNK